MNASLGSVCLTGTTVTPHSVSLTWGGSTSSGLAGYKVYRGTVSNGPYSLLATLGQATSYTDSKVQAGQTYYYVTTASVTGAESIYSNQIKAVMPTP